MLWKLFGKVAKAAQEVDDRIEAAKDARDHAEAVVGRGILAGRFATRAVDGTRRLREAADAGKPPGILKTGEELAGILLPEADAEEVVEIEVPRVAWYWGDSDCCRRCGGHVRGAGQLPGCPRCGFIGDERKDPS